MDLDKEPWKFGDIVKYNNYNRRDYSKLKSKFIEIRSLTAKGLAEGYHFKSIIQFVMLTAIGLKVYDMAIPTIIYPIIGISGLVGAWLIGKLWDKAHLYHYEHEFSNTRNPFAKDLRSKLEIEEGVKE
jgi:hypothetical protein